MTITATRSEDRAFWRQVLEAGGRTEVPRWTLHPRPGVAEHEEAVAPALMTGLRARATDLGVSPGAVLAAVHAYVLSALAGEVDVVSGFVAPGDGPDRRVLPCRLAAAVGSWRQLIGEAERVTSEIGRRADFPVAELAEELGIASPAYETELDPVEPPDGPLELSPGVALRVALAPDQRVPALRVRYRTDVIDEAAATRIAGYHLTALRHAVAEPDTSPQDHSLVSPEELTLQVTGLAGAVRARPDQRWHELFERQVATAPDVVAAVCEGVEWTYRELNERANRVGRSLLARGLAPEDVVAVVAHRHLGWLATVIGVLKAGGVYLPVEPGFPSERVARMLTRAGCRLVLTDAEPERGEDVSVHLALDGLPGVQVVSLGDALAEADGRQTRDDTLNAGNIGLGVAVGAEQAAYLYFTSGSTGEPKGALCEHAGFVNHLFAKIEDLGIHARSVVAQTAPQCFDISLWQLVAALAVGGRTVIVPQATILDVERLVETLVAERVTVLQVVPSYLEAVMTYLEAHPRCLPDLTAVSVTGEAVGPELVRRWFGLQSTTGRQEPIALVNAYGLTETSDDTNHEVMTQPPDGSRVPLGAPVPNVTVYVLDEQRRPVPLGAPGEIAFSGVCVGRGYVNDPDRTAAVFGTDPLRPGERLYLAGDYGRWRPDGKLEFLGRRDAQVKVRGFRIEIDEIEIALARVPGVREAAVVVTGIDGGPQQLVAFCASAPHAPLSAETLRKGLAVTLPAYMVPSSFHRLDRLPLTANGKTDRKALRALATVPPGETHERGQAPRSQAERRLAAAWARVLGVAESDIGSGDHFFDRGGTSLTAVKLVVALGRTVALRDVIDHPVLADLARLLDDAEAVADLGRNGSTAAPDPLADFPADPPSDQERR